jgi:hypothetical protein
MIVEERKPATAADDPGPGAAGLFRRFDTLVASMDTSAQIAVILERMDQQDTQLHRIFEQTSRTNGRVTAIESARLVEAALREAAAATLKVEKDGRAKRVDRRMAALTIAGGMVSGIVGYLFLAATHLHL